MGIFDTAKDLANVFKKAGKIDEYRTISELLDDLLDKKNQIQLLNEEISVLTKKLKTKDDFEFKNGAYFNKTSHDGPYCPSCYDLKFDTIRIFQKDPEDIDAQCPVCKNNFNITGRSSSLEYKKAYDAYINDFDPNSIL